MLMNTEFDAGVTGLVATRSSYEAPVVTDGGAVAEVTLGKNNFDVTDNTQYKQKPPGVSGL
jgi:hypothetical protein